MTYKLILPTGELREVPRATEVIRAGMPRPALVHWELYGAVDWAIRHRSKSAPAAISAFRRENREAAVRGTAVHAWIAQILRDGEPRALLVSQRGYRVAFTSWMVEHLDGNLRGALVEQTMTSSGCSVAGTADLVWQRHLYDWKTVEEVDDRPMWPDQRAQLGAYASMTQLVDSGGQVRGPAPAVEAASIVRLGADGRHRTLTLRGADLRDAIALWYAVRMVALAGQRDRAISDADTKENN